MKKLLLILGALLALNANADTVASMPNNGGGKIVLTDKECQSDSRQFMAYTTSQSISTQFGCWFSDDSMVHISWESTGSFKSYPLENWDVNRAVLDRLRSRLKRGAGV